MMYNSKFVANLKSKEGKILRENGDTVLMPFGTEYSIFLKNLESRKAKVKITIDGVDVLNGNSLIVNQDDTCELEGFMDNLNAKNSFRFIEKTQEISNYRGDKIDDGIVRIEFWFEKMKPIIQDINYNYKYNWNYYNPIYTTDTPKFGDTTVYYSDTKPIDCNLKSIGNQVTYSVQNCSLDNFNANDVGITVKGSEISQQFQYGNIGELESQSHVIILRLKGYKEDKKVENVVTVDDKKMCKTCGKQSKYNSKFCDRCGTFLN